jgi:hypothetical protein
MKSAGRSQVFWVCQEEMIKMISNGVDLSLPLNIRYQLTLRLSVICKDGIPLLGQEARRDFLFHLHHGTGVGVMLGTDEVYIQAARVSFCCGEIILRLGYLLVMDRSEADIPI